MTPTASESGFATVNPERASRSLPFIEDKELCEERSAGDEVGEVDLSGVPNTNDEGGLEDDRVEFVRLWISGEYPT